MKSFRQKATVTLLTEEARSSEVNILASPKSPAVVYRACPSVKYYNQNFQEA